MLTLFLAVTIAMSVSFLCSLMEAAILSLNPGKLAMLQKKNARAGKICAGFKKNIEKPIAVILILNTAAHTFGAAIAGAEFDKLFGSNYVWLFSLIFTILMVQYTEILPKTLGVRFNAQVMSLTAGFLKFSIGVINPVIWFVHFVNRPFETRRSSSEKTASLDELDALATVAREEKCITRLQEFAIQEIPDLQEDYVTEVMIPLDRMVCASLDMSKSDVLLMMRAHRHSRYPVRKSAESDEFVGVIELRKMIFDDGDDWQKLVTPPVTVSSDCTLLRIAENVRQYDSKLLLVSGKDGRIAGMLTTNNLFMRLFPHGASASKAS